MSRLNVNPTRMELKKLKARLKTSVRGHKLLKDKSDEMIRRFSILLRRNKKLREEVEAELSNVLKQFSFAKSLTKDEIVEQAFSMPSISVNADFEETSVMGVTVPKITLEESKGELRLPYAYSTITSEADYSVMMMMKLIPKLVELCEVEKSVKRLSDEIEKNKRRVNALEYFIIPQLEETIKYITIKLDENERGSLVRLMKVKDMLAKENN